MGHESEKKLLFGLILLQIMCALFFLWDGSVDVILGAGYQGWAEPQNFEFIVSIALIASLIFTAKRLHTVMQRHKVMKDQIRIASGAFAELLNEHFDQWGLSPAETDVSILAIKGLSIAEIAGIRNAKEGTVKAQLNAVYRKAGVTGRTQLLSNFIEELMGEGLEIEPKGKSPR